jgi:HlyD family secretion protein
MNSPRERIAVSGAGMDAVRPSPPKRRRVIAGAAIVAVAIAVAVFWSFVPRGLRVNLDSIRIATAERGVFNDDLVVRANAESQNAIVLDAIETGRVEEVFVRDGAIVKQGELLFRLSNAQRRMELLQRQSERAQQLSNLANLEVTFEVARNEHAQRIGDLRYELAQAQKQLTRNNGLASRGFISAAGQEEAADKVALQRERLKREEANLASESTVRHAAMKKMAGAISGLELGLQLANATVGALAVRAPTSGRLTDFNLKVGEAVKADQRLGHIDDPRFKLTAQIDEYYLSRVSVGRRGMARVNERNFSVEVSRVYPQVKDRRFTIELTFATDSPKGLQPGMSVDANITLGQPATGLVLPNGPYMSDTGGAWVYLLSKDGTSAERRPVRTGRRNNAQVEIVSGLVPGDRVIFSGYTAYGDAERLQFN